MTERRAPYRVKRTSRLEEALYQQMRFAGLDPVREFYFARPRRFRADFAFPKQKLLIECEGGVFTGGRHVTGAGYTHDCLKYNLATMAGYRVLRFTREMIEDGSALALIVEALEE